MNTPTLDTTPVRRWKRYPEYRPSGTDWLPQVPGHWDAKRLKYLAAPSRRRLFEKPDDATYIGLEQIESKTGKLLLDNPVETVESNMGAFDRGDVLFGKLRPYLAKVAAPPFAGVCTTEVTVYRPRPEVHGDYLKYQLLSAEFIDFINTMAYGTKMPRVSEEQMSEARLAVPPLAEQRAIAAFLDRETARIDSLIGHKERLIALLEEKRQAVISHAVTRGLDPSAPLKDSGVPWLGMVPSHWTMTRLKFVAPLQGGYAFKSESFCDDGIPIVRMNNLRRGILDLDESMKVPESEAPRAFSLNEGNLLIGLSGSLGETGSLGNYAVVRRRDLPCYLNQRVGRFRPTTNLATAYLQLVIQSKAFSEPLIANSEGTAQFNISTREIGEVRIALPAILEQGSILSFLTETERSTRKVAARIRDGIERLQEYRTALISAAVTGQIDVRGEVPL